MATAASGPASPYQDGPPPGSTGGFADPKCHRCHFDRPINQAGGRLTVDGVGAVYTAGRNDLFTLTLLHPQMGRGGFQLAARFIEGPRGGQGAGGLQPVTTGADGERFHPNGLVRRATRAGTILVGRDTARWVVRWTAPDPPEGNVVFHIAANAANDDASEFGDLIYVARLCSSAR